MRVCDLLLVRHCDYGPILHRFWDTATYWLKNYLVFLPSLIRRPRSLCSLWNFALKLTMRKLESWDYPPVKTRRSQLEAFWHDTRLWRTDGRTDRQTDGIYRSYYSALHSKLFWRAVKIQHKQTDEHDKSVKSSIKVQQLMVKQILWNIRFKPGKKLKSSM